MLNPAANSMGFSVTNLREKLISIPVKEVKALLQDPVGYSQKRMDRELEVSEKLNLDPSSKQITPEILAQLNAFDLIASVIDTFHQVNADSRPTKARTTAREATSHLKREMYSLRRLDGRVNLRAVMNLFLLPATIIASAALILSCVGKDSDNNPGGDDGDVNAMCANLLATAAKLGEDHILVSASALDQAGQPGGDLSQVNADLACVDPDLQATAFAPLFDVVTGAPVSVFQVINQGNADLPAAIAVEVPAPVNFDLDNDGKPDVPARELKLFNLDPNHAVTDIDKYGYVTGSIPEVVFNVDTQQFEPTGNVMQVEGNVNGNLTITIINSDDNGGSQIKVELKPELLANMIGVSKIADLLTEKQVDLENLNQVEQYPGVDPFLHLGVEQADQAGFELPQDIVKFLRSHNLAPLLDTNGNAGRLGSNNTCSVNMPDHLVDSGAELSGFEDVEGGQVKYSVNGTETVGQFLFQLPNGVRCVASVAQSGSDFAPGTVVVTFFSDSAKAGAQVINEIPMRVLVDNPNQVTFIVNEDSIQLITTDANGSEIETQMVMFGIGGIDFQLGAPDASGARVIEKFIAPENPTIEQQYALDQLTTDVGFENGATTWLQKGDGRVVLVDSQDHSNVIAEWKAIFRDKDGKVTMGVEWDWSKMVGPDGENILFSGARVFPASNGGMIFHPDFITIHSDQLALFNQIKVQKGLLKNIVSGLIQIFQYSSDGNKMIPISISKPGGGQPDEIRRASKLFLFFQSDDTGKSDLILVTNFQINEGQ